MRPLAIVCLACCALPLWGAQAGAGKKPVSIDALMRPNARRGMGRTIWAPDGTRFLIEAHKKLSLYDVPSGKTSDIISLDKLEAAAEKEASPSPAFDWTNRRVSEHDVQWFADGKRLLIASSGDLFIVDIATGHFEQLTKTAEVEQDPKLSPDNQSVAFRRGPNLYALNLQTKAITELTHDGSETLLNGQPDWVYPEELDLSTAFWWSPDSRSIAYMQFDIAHEPLFPEVSLLGEHGIYEPERFPQPGDPNAEVRVGVVSATGSETRWMNFGETRGYLIARVGWLPSSRELAIERLPRIQNKLDVLVADVETGVSHTLLHEEDSQWINVKGDLHFLSDGRLLWTSERSGFRHLYLYDASGKLEKQLTSGDWEVDDIAGVDEPHSRVFYTSSEASPLERQLYVVSFDGANKQQLTTGAGTHAISLSPSCSYFLDRYSSLTEPPRSTLYTAEAKQIRVYSAPDPAETEYEILPTEIVKVKANDGTLLYARLIKPAGFQPGKKYPAIVMVYGGPGVQSIHNAWPGVSWDQLLAQHGFVIWQLDNRGSIGRGHRFEAVVYHDLGEHELEDQKTGIEHLISLGFVDPQRIGMYGWSYGGFMTLNTLLNAPGLIKAGISGAPVTSWRNYDSIYTERYMGLPQDNEQAYAARSLLPRAANLTAKLLIVHNLEDDNVHFQNTMQMVNALEKANKQFYMVVYPEKSHGVSGPIRRQLLEETTAFFEQSLR